MKILMKNSFLTPKVKQHILNSHKSWIKNIGYIPKLFAYPYGESSNEVIDILKEFGISHAFGQHSGVISSFDNQYYLPRFSLNERFGDIDRFEFAVNAYYLNIKDLEIVPSRRTSKGGVANNKESWDKSSRVWTIRNNVLYKEYGS